MDALAPELASETPNSNRSPWRAAFARAAAIYGGQGKLSRACGFNRNAVHFAIHYAEKPPVELAIAIANVTGGEVGLKELAPDVFRAAEQEIIRDFAKNRAA